MKTSATNRRIRVLLTAIKDGSLVPRPEFQRRLVWTNKHKLEFIKTVLMEYPFPEIYVAAGKVDPDSGEGQEMLVDGQQRLTTLLLRIMAQSGHRICSKTATNMLQSGHHYAESGHPQEPWNDAG